MRICMITREFPPKAAGIGFYVYYLAKKLIQRGHKVDVITRGNVAKTKMESIEGINVYRVTFIPLYPLHIWLHGLFVNSILKALEPHLSIVHLHSPLVPPIRTSLPVVTTIHSPCKRAYENTYLDTRDLYSLAERLQSMVVKSFIESKILAISKKITSVSSNVSEEMRSYGLNPQNIKVVGNAVDENLFVPKHKRTEPDIYVLFVGIFRSGKGIFDLLEVARCVCNERSDVRFLLCGKGPLIRSVQAEIKKQGLQKKVILLGFADRTRIVKLYQKATLLVQPSYHEGLSTVVLEAMSCGLPVVANDIAGNRTVISSGVNGILVPLRSPKIMAKAVLELLNDPYRRERIGKAARTTILASYTWEKIADNIIECYENAIQH
jgi:glycosyltransferase involved in cell wall biosynthesis